MMINEFDYKITKQVYEWIVNGTKNIEIRLYNEKSSKIKVDDIINFKVVDNEELKIKVKVMGLLIYKNINSLLSDIDIKNIANINRNDLEKMLYDIFGEEKVKNSNIIGIKFNVLEVQ